MRDGVILLLLVAVTIWSLRQPWIAIMNWTLVSLMSPHVQFGYAAADWPVATGVAICALLGLVTSKEKQNPMIGAAPWCLLAFALWTTATLQFAYYYDDSFPLWVRSMKIWLMIYVTLALVDTRRKLDVFIWMNVIALGYYGVKGGAFTLLTGGNYRVWGPGGFIEGNNEVALAVIMTIPLMRYLQQQMTNKRLRLVMSGAMGLSAVMALGTYSRGALLGLIAMGSMFWWKSGNRVVWGVLILVLGTAGLSLMPEQWWNRMDTIKTYDADDSAMGRINAWWMAWNLAKDNFFGGGFMVWMPEMFQKYAPVPQDVHAAHSIYFQVLGEHGFIGLMLFLSIGATTWWAARDLVRMGRADPQHQWAADLGGAIQAAMVGYAITGSFLSLAYFDLPYNVMVMAVLARKFVQTQTAAAAPPRFAAPDPAARMR